MMRIRIHIYLFLLFSLVAVVACSDNTPHAEYSTKDQSIYLQILEFERSKANNFHNRDDSLSAVTQLGVHKEFKILDLEEHGHSTGEKIVSLLYSEIVTRTGSESAFDDAFYSHMIKQMNDISAVQEYMLLHLEQGQEFEYFVPERKKFRLQGGQILPLASESITAAEDPNKIVTGIFKKFCSESYEIKNVDFCNHFK